MDSVLTTVGAAHHGRRTRSHPGFPVGRRCMDPRGRFCPLAYRTSPRRSPSWHSWRPTRSMLWAVSTATRLRRHRQGAPVVVDSPPESMVHNALEHPTCPHDRAGESRCREVVVGRREATRAVLANLWQGSRVVRGSNQRNHRLAQRPKVVPHLTSAGCGVAVVLRMRASTSASSWCGSSTSGGPHALQNRSR
jgi:hypothetical protein